MAGLYRQTYRNKKTIKLSPDALVLIGERPDIEICPICEAKINLSDYITTITTNLANNTTVGTASITLAIPRHGHEGNYLVRGGRVFGVNLMDEIEIYFKGRFAKDSQGNREYYRVFWGMVTNIQESYSDGFQNITISCESILKWLQMMQTNEHPSVLVLRDNVTQYKSSDVLYAGKTYASLNVYEIIFSMVNISLLNIVVPEGFDTELSITDEKGKGVSSTVIHPKDIELMDYWVKRFSRIKTNIKMFGTDAESFLPSDYQAKQGATNSSNSSDIRASQNPITPIKINYNSKALMDFRPFLKPDDRKDLDIFTSSYKSNLEIINEVRLLAGYEFFLDCNGEIIFKPPFWNLDTSNNKVFTLEDSDIISWDYSEDANQVVTRVEVTGSFAQEAQGGLESSPRGVYTDWVLARQFGIKSAPIPGRLFTTAKMCYYHAVSELDRINSMRYNASVTIIGRPELRLGIPVYIKSRDCFGYIDNISHNFSFGGQFTTNLELSAIRRKYIGNSLSAAKLKTTEGNTRSFELTGKSAMLVFTRTLNLDDLYKKLETNSKEEEKSIKDRIINPSESDIQNSDSLRKDKTSLFKSNRVGEYVELELSDPLAQKILQDAQRSKNSDSQDSYLNFLEVAIPVSDEKGYELIGTYENGRCLELTANGLIRKKAGSFSEILQKVLSGTDTRSKASAVGPSDESENYVEDYSKVGTLAEKEEIDKTTEKQIIQFSQIKSKSLLDLKPSAKDIKSCTCYDPVLTSNLKSSLVVEDGKNKPMGQITNKK
jgi:hypothetical protein